MKRAGAPIQSCPDGTSWVTMLPAAIIAFSPMVMPGRMVALAPMLAPFFMVVCGKESGYCFERGKRSLVNVALGPIKTLSSMRMPSHSCTPLLTVTLLPTMTSFSMRTPAQMLQLLPMMAPGSTTQNCQMLVFWPIDVDWTSASWCTMFFDDEFVVVADVVVLGVDVGGEDEADGTGGEVVECPPYSGNDVESLVWAVEEEGAFDLSVVECDGKAA